MKMSENQTVIIYLSGKPGTGKYTIAKALSRYEFIVCDNQLINNPIFELLNYDGLTSIPKFAWEAIDHLRNVVFDFLKVERKNNYVLTNNLYEDDEDLDLYNQVKDMAEARGSKFIPVRLVISEEEHLKRITQPERRNRWKSIDPEEVYDQRPLLKIEHQNYLELDVSTLKAEEAAEFILRA
jgi:DUF438 domain-containing protein